MMNQKPILSLAFILLLNFHSGIVKAQAGSKGNPINRYSFDLYHQTKVAEGNLLLSPASTWFALMTAYEGSEGATKQEFEKVLFQKNPGAGDEMKLNGIVRKSDQSPSLQISNAVWVDTGLNVEKDYRKRVSDFHSTDFRQTLFSNPKRAVSEINRWVTERTNNRITEMVSAENFNPDTRLLISNAVYFKDEWLEKFEKKMTRPATFFAGIEDQFTIDFMQKKELLSYYETDDFQFVSKPYATSGISFGVLLPKQFFGIGELEAKLGSEMFDRILDSVYYAKVNLLLPKMELESSFELSDALKGAGLTTAFTNDADFSGITRDVPLKLGQVLHKTWLSMDEEKTEAAAATNTIVRIGAGRLDAYKIVKADHPFVFFIFDQTTRSILFMGRYSNPPQGQKLVADAASLATNVAQRESEPFEFGDKERQVLYIVDGKTITEAELRDIDPDNIDAISVYNDYETIRKFTTGNYSGVVVVTMKK